MLVPGALDFKITWEASSCLTEDMLTQIVRQLQNKDPKVRAVALDRLNQIESPDKRAIPHVIEALRDSDAEVSDMAAYVLYSRFRGFAVPFLARGLAGRDPDFQVRIIESAKRLKTPPPLC